MFSAHSRLRHAVADTFALVCFLFVTLLLFLFLQISIFINVLLLIAKSRLAEGTAPDSQ
ncbi:hypothetical protein ACSLO7_30155, partial [Klebsiella pneumoniae]